MADPFAAYEDPTAPYKADPYAQLAALLASAKQQDTQQNPMIQAAVATQNIPSLRNGLGQTTYDPYGGAVKTLASALMGNVGMGQVQDAQGARIDSINSALAQPDGAAALAKDSDPMVRQFAAALLINKQKEAAAKADAIDKLRQQNLFEGIRQISVDKAKADAEAANSPAAKARAELAAMGPDVAAAHASQSQPLVAPGAPNPLAWTPADDLAVKKMIAQDIPPTQADQNIRQQKALQADTIKSQNKLTFADLDTQRTRSQHMLDLVGKIQSALDAGVYTAPGLGQINQTANSLLAPFSADAAAKSTAGVQFANVIPELMGILRQPGQRLAQAEVMLALQGKPGLNQSREANQSLVDTMRAMAQRQQSYVQLAESVIGSGGTQADADRIWQTYTAKNPTIIGTPDKGVIVNPDAQHWSSVWQPGQAFPPVVPQMTQGASPAAPTAMQQAAQSVTAPVSQQSGGAVPPPIPGFRRLMNDDGTITLVPIGR